MDKAILSKFQFEDYRVETIDFQLNPEFEYKEQLSLNFKLDAVFALSTDLSRAKVKLTANIFENAIENNYPFSLNVTVVGYFITDEKMTEEQLSKFAELNGATALFPFLRSIVADVTRTANVEAPLVLPLINVHALLKEQRKNTKLIEK